MSLISLNSKDYKIKGAVIRQPLLEWPNNLRLTGQQERTDRSMLSSWVMDDWSGGLGIEVMNLAKPDTSQKPQCAGKTFPVSPIPLAHHISLHLHHFRPGIRSARVVPP